MLTCYVNDWDETDVSQFDWLLKLIWLSGSGIGHNGTIHIEKLFLCQYPLNIQYSAISSIHSVMVAHRNYMEMIRREYGSIITYHGSLKHTNELYNALRFSGTVG